MENSGFRIIYRHSWNVAVTENRRRALIFKQNQGLVEPVTIFNPTNQWITLNLEHTTGSMDPKSSMGSCPTEDLYSSQLCVHLRYANQGGRKF